MEEDHCHRRSSTRSRRLLCIAKGAFWYSHVRESANSAIRFDCDIAIYFGPGPVEVIEGVEIHCKARRPFAGLIQRILSFQA
jgi:hypothetical protein